MSKHISPSRIVMDALGFNPDGVPAEEEGLCAFCGTTIHKGDLCSPFKVTSQFTDSISLAAKGSELTCGDCSVLITNQGLKATTHGIFSKSGVMPFNTWNDISFGLLNPPEPPFVMLHKTATNNQHMAWRAPVNFSKKLFYIRLGLRDVKIRTDYLHKAIQACQNVGLAIGKKNGAKTLANPFTSLSPKLKESNHADLTSLLQTLHTEKFQHHLENESFMNDLQHTMGLTLGETWALRFILTPNAGL